MKKLLITPLVLFSFVASAQTTIQLRYMEENKVLVPNEGIETIVFAWDNRKVNIDIKNTSTSPQTYNAKRYDVLLNKDLTDTADAYYCFGGSCYGPDAIISPNTLHLQPGKSASDTTDSNPLAAYYSLTADLDEVGTPGKSIVKYTFFNVNVASDSVQITIYYNRNVGLNAINNDISSIDVFPNPANESSFLKINALKAFESKLTIYNSLGAVVSEKPTLINAGKNNIELKTENLAAGIYFVNLKTNESTVTKRLIVK